LLSFGLPLRAYDVRFGPENELVIKMLDSKVNRRVFIDDVVKVVREYKFDGFDVNWSPVDNRTTKHKLENLLKELRETFNEEKHISKLPRLILTAGQAPKRTDFHVESEFVDYYMVMTFDYHGPWENQTGFQTPINSLEIDSINNTIRHLIDDHHLPKEKLVLGLSAVGRGWTIDSKEDPKVIPSPALGPSPAGAGGSGRYNYFEICQMLEKDGFVREWNELAQAPFMYKIGTNETIWVTYDSRRSFHATMDFIESMDLGGAFVWRIDQDDFDGRCSASNGKYPLTKVVSDRILGKPTIRN